MPPSGEACFSPFWALHRAISRRPLRPKPVADRAERPPAARVAGVPVAAGQPEQAEAAASVEAASERVDRRAAGPAAAAAVVAAAARRRAAGPGRVEHRSAGEPRSAAESRPAGERRSAGEPRLAGPRREPAGSAWGSSRSHAMPQHPTLPSIPLRLRRRAGPHPRRPG